MIVLSNESYDYFGTLTAQGSDTLFTYRLFFTIDSSDQIKGFSITDINGPNESSSYVSSKVCYIKRCFR